METRGNFARIAMTSEARSLWSAEVYGTVRPEGPVNGGQFAGSSIWKSPHKIRERTPEETRDESASESSEQDCSNSKSGLEVSGR